MLVGDLSNPRDFRGTALKDAIFVVYVAQVRIAMGYRMYRLDYVLWG